MCKCMGWRTCTYSFIIIGVRRYERNWVTGLRFVGIRLEAFGARSSDFGADIYGDTIDRSLANATCKNLNLPRIGQEQLALQVPICASARTIRALRVSTQSGHFAPTLCESESWNQRLCRLPCRRHDAR